MTDQDGDQLLFDVLTPLGFRVRCSVAYWERKIIGVHPVMHDKLAQVMAALSSPIEVRLSNQDAAVYLFYSTDEKRLVCAVTRRLDEDGFLITAYPSDKIKAGESVWTP